MCIPMSSLNDTGVGLGIVYRVSRQTCIKMYSYIFTFGNHNYSLDSNGWILLKQL